MSDQRLDDEFAGETPEAEAPASEAASSETLQAELEEARAKAAEYLDGWQRAQADFANYKKRTERERAEVYQYAADALIVRFLAVLDDFERALKDKPDLSSEAEGWAAGIDLICRKLQAVLEAQGITRMEAAGQTFDPRLHEAVTHEESDEHEEGEIIETLQPGYLRGERVIRPAMVRVARASGNNRDQQA